MMPANVLAGLTVTVLAQSFREDLAAARETVPVVVFCITAFTVEPTSVAGSELLGLSLAGIAQRNACLCDIPRRVGSAFQPVLSSHQPHTERADRTTELRGPQESKLIPSEVAEDRRLPILSRQPLDLRSGEPEIVAG